MTLAEALKIRAVVPVSELRIARHFARVWKMAAKKARFDVMLLKSINKANREVYEVRIDELEGSSVAPEDAPDTTQSGECACCGGETFVVEITRCRGCEQEFYTSDQSLTASRLVHSENAQEGPWKIVSTMEPDAFVVRKSGVKCGRGPFTWAEVVAVCDRLNRLHRRTGDKK